RNGTQIVVASLMSEVVIDQLEKINICSQQAQGFLRALPACVLALQRIIEKAAVGQSGEIVRVSQDSQFSIHLFKRFALFLNMPVASFEQIGETPVATRHQIETKQHHGTDTNDHEHDQPLTALCHVTFNELLLAVLVC